MTKGKDVYEASEALPAHAECSMNRSNSLPADFLFFLIFYNWAFL